MTPVEYARQGDPCRSYLWHSFITLAGSSHAKPCMASRTGLSSHKSIRPPCSHTTEGELNVMKMTAGMYASTISGGWHRCQHPAAPPSSEGGSVSSQPTSRRR